MRTCSIKYASERQTSSAGHTMTVDIKQEPVVGPKRSMKPNCVVETRHHQVVPLPRQRVWRQRDSKRILIRKICERARLNQRIIGDSLQCAQP